VGIDFEEREPEAYFGIYRGLRQANVDFVVIGGQACNIWALLYEDSELAKERPYTSTDVDVYSKRQADVFAACKRAVGRA
jgi:hypothetical protein